MARASASLLCFLLLLGAFAASASAATSYLRPNGVTAINQWSVAGAPTASEVLDDNVLETETPAGADYITTSESTGSVKLDLSTVSLAGVSNLTAQAWFYTSTAAPVRLYVRETGGSGFVTLTAAKAGWHSVNVFLTKGQAQLDGAYLEFVPATGSGSRQVSAAFLKLSYDDFPSSVYWGAWMDGDVPLMKGQPSRGDAPWEKATWEEFKFNSGRKNPSIIHFGQPPPWIQEFAKGPLELSAEKQAIPMMDMASDLPHFEQHVTLKEIAAGELDADLEQWSAQVAEYGKPFFFRWNWEMNLPTAEPFPYALEAKESPPTYVAAWRRFHDIAETEGATNITWVWCPNVTFPGSTPLIYLWPGSNYVDWTCMDGYNHGTNPLQSSGWLSFYNLFDNTYEELTTGLASQKPIMIGETASTEFGGSKASWIADALVTQLPQSFPKIKAVVWFNWNIEEGGGRWDWPIESSASSEVSFASAISSPYYAPGTFANLPALTRIQPLP